MIFRITVRIKTERAFLVLMVLATIIFLVVAVSNFTEVPATTVEAAAEPVITIPEVTVPEVKTKPAVELILVKEASIAEEPVVEVHTHCGEEPVYGITKTLATASPEDVEAAYQYIRDLYLLAKLIHCEAGIDNMAGKLAVATVVMNRVEHSNKNLYGGPTLEGVIYHKLSGDSSHQFSCIDNEELWSEEPGKDDYEAARKVLDGYRTFGSDYLYYYNPKACDGTRGIDYDDEPIGKHIFGKEAE